jgi:hypothetical protein
MSVKKEKVLLLENRLKSCLQVCHYSKNWVSYNVLWLEEEHHIDICFGSKQTRHPKESLYTLGKVEELLCRR